MPGETHQIDSDIDADSVLALLQAVLVPAGLPSDTALLIAVSAAMDRWTC